ncbi:unnamed protein product, partial [Polarella glacialis]
DSAADPRTVLASAMTVLKGEKVHLDDLFGYAKLQELLGKLIGHVNEQEEAASKFQGEISRKLNEQ